MCGPEMPKGWTPLVVGSAGEDAVTDEQCVPHSYRGGTSWNTLKNEPPQKPRLQDHCCNLSAQHSVGAHKYWLNGWMDGWMPVLVGITGSGGSGVSSQSYRIFQTRRHTFPHPQFGRKMGRRLTVRMQLPWLTVAVEQVFFPYFPSLKPRYVLWSGASYSPKIWYIFIN